MNRLIPRVGAFVLSFALLAGVAVAIRSSSAAIATAPRAVTFVSGSGASVSAVAIRLAPPTTVPPATTPGGPPAGRFGTLPVGAALPSDAACAALVRPAAERRPSNAAENRTIGVGALAVAAGQHAVTGNFTGTTDELIQWTACKWGIDEDVVRAQIAKESWWRQDAKGDLTTNQSICFPSLQTGSGQCPESIGLGQVRFSAHAAAFANQNVIRSSAFNLDYTYAVWRTCYNGEYTWLNNVERGANYVAGDMWGCLGVWFSGRWYTADAKAYIAAVQDYQSRRIWETAEFQNG